MDNSISTKQIPIALNKYFGMPTLYTGDFRVSLQLI